MGRNHCSSVVAEFLQALFRPVAVFAGLGLLAGAPVRAEGAWPVPADLNKLCEGWNGKWRAEIDRAFTAGKGWGPGTMDPDWRVEQSEPGRCMFRFGESAFQLDTRKGFYDVTTFTDGKPGPVRRGKFLFADVADAKTWNVVVEGVGVTPNIYRMQMTMADDVFAIYLTASGTDPAKLTPDGITVHRRR